MQFINVKIIIDKKWRLSFFSHRIWTPGRIRTLVIVSTPPPPDANINQLLATLLLIIWQLLPTSITNIRKRLFGNIIGWKKRVFIICRTLISIFRDNWRNSRNSPRYTDWHHPCITNRKASPHTITKKSCNAVYTGWCYWRYIASNVSTQRVSNHRPFTIVATDTLNLYTLWLLLIIVVSYAMTEMGF